jgi:hypothetical protein
VTDIRPAERPEIRAEIMAWLDGSSAAELWYKAAAAGHYDWPPLKSSTDPSEAGSVLRGRDQTTTTTSARGYSSRRTYPARYEQ